MSLIASMRRVMARAFAGFPECYVTRLGVVVGIPDPPQQEEATGPFRPRYAVDVQLLTPQGETDGARPVLEALPLPAFGGVYAFPELGQRVRIAYDYGLPSRPYIVNILSEGEPAPALQPGERAWRHSEGNELRWDRLGNLRVQTDGTVTTDAFALDTAADTVTEALGAVTRTIESKLQETLGDHEQAVLGGKTVSVGADYKLAALGSAELVTLGDLAVLAAGKAEIVGGLGVKLLTVPGVGKIAIGDGVIEVLHILDALITQMVLETHTSTVPPNPTSPPLNFLLYLAEQVKVQALKTLP